MDNRHAFRLRVAQYHLQNGISLRQTAVKFHIAYRTVFKWVRLLKEQGEQGLLSRYKRPWNRAAPDFEEKVVLMKEHEPGLTVRQARAILEREGIRISIKGIWGIWKRHGYAGFNQKNISTSFTDCPWTKEAEKKCELAKQLYECGALDRSAKTLNSIPALPENALLAQIPDSLLNIRRQIEKMGLLFGKIPVRSYLERLRILYEECQTRNLHHSIFIVGLLEIKALSWSGEPLEMLNKVRALREILEISGKQHANSLFTPRLALLIAEGFAHTGLLRIKSASDIARTCRTLLR